MNPYDATEVETEPDANNRDAFFACILSLTAFGRIITHLLWNMNFSIPRWYWAVDVVCYWMNVAAGISCAFYLLTRNKR